ncbi:hypothetical protein AOXY_G32819 [Acipenser oxyrinchus oxyrinchus]|uniref:Uncharacterized protein n=1 Tax=Acipenser oxyrinchus oxyrinchus TaxID=40147 RepID=A0AAD8FR91_ACIOX|nr:hypothetical protein AOXY_G33094 [Acipenser oxyrinchus oxyrinchus]KAK1151252.1 hypothetical protein AOXY_G32819 [Acipenser oxyrinchus oxyrinchus]
MVSREGEVAVLRSWKPRLIEVLGADPDLLLQHADSRCLLTPQEYRSLKSTRDPSEKTRDLLDRMIDKGGPATSSFLEILQLPDVLESFPKLEELGREAERRTAKKRKVEAVDTSEDPSVQDKRNGRSPADRVQQQNSVSSSDPCSKHKGCQLVTEQQLMRLSGMVGREWKQVGRQLLGILTHKLEHFEEENPRSRTERVFAMLLYWRTREGEGATASRLHQRLTAEGSPIHPQPLTFLLEPS